MTYLLSTAQQGEHDGQLYLARQVEVQPVFNREFIAELSDVASANLLSLDNLLGTEGGNKRRGEESLADGTGIEGHGTSGGGSTWTMDLEHGDSAEALEDLEHALVVAVKAGDQAAINDLLRALLAPANVRGPTDSRSPISRILWRAVLEKPASTPNGVAPTSTTTTDPAHAENGVTPVADEAIPTSLLDFTFIDDINGRTSLHEVGRFLPHTSTALERITHLVLLL